jgi:Arc/MetJ family transcription regulator
MTQVTMEIDDDLLAQAAETLGSGTPEDTVIRALRTFDDHLRRVDAFAELQRLAARGAFDVDLHEVREAVDKAISQVANERHARRSGGTAA